MRDKLAENTFLEKFNSIFISIKNAITANDKLVLSASHQMTSHR